MRVFIIFIFFASPWICRGQYIEKRSLIPAAYPQMAQRESVMDIRSGYLTSSVCFKVRRPDNFENGYIIAGADTFRLTRNEEVPDEVFQTSDLVIFPLPVNQFRISIPNVRDSAEVYLINAEAANFPPVTGQSLVRKFGGQNLKTLPDMIDQSIWRQGLPEPHYDRIHNTVRNIIIHHSATSNLVTDYTSAIRNIYLYHTGVNHWSDIGYNYVVAPDGSIYKGRDPGIYPQDEVLGAHFCSSNTGTMGICVLGTYTNVGPSDTSMRSLEKLLVWKLAKDRLDPLGVTPHPLNTDLDVICGHRNGCVTLCPGDSLYAELFVLRSRVYETMILLGNGQEEIMAANRDQPVRIYPNPAADQLTIESSADIQGIRVLDSFGRLVMNREGGTRHLNISRLANGWYQLIIILPDQPYSQKFIKF